MRRTTIAKGFFVLVAGALIGGTTVAVATPNDPCQAKYASNTIKSLQAYVDCREDRQDAELAAIREALDVPSPTPSATPSVTKPPPATPEPTVTPSVTPSAVVTPSATPSPSVSQTPTASPTASPAGFPNAANTGVPAGTTLTAYTGPCTITAANTVIDSKRITCDLNIRAAGVIVKNSELRSIGTDEESSGYSFTITDSLVAVGSRPGTGIGAVNFTAIRVHVTGGNRSVNCYKSCTIRDSYVHGQFTDNTGVYHESGIRLGSNSTLVGNTIACDAPDVPPDAGCSAAVSGYGDFGQVRDVLVQGNQIVAGSGGYCAYAGSTAGKPYPTADNVRYINNVFQRSGSTQNNRRSCGYYGDLTGWLAEPGSELTNNTYDDGTPIRYVGR